jgi:hypothetical protein
VAVDCEPSITSGRDKGTTAGKGTWRRLEIASYEAVVWVLSFNSICFQAIVLSTHGCLFAGCADMVSIGPNTTAGHCTRFLGGSSRP